ncbi:hypothetical protein IWX90DRAFT_6708 [Phyllosticta citrichinensis]|uniref:Uncharacterized protein n=1 Tax=Phyllosticta citrichinensis TaxID=1130410 RepID=A0ABR1Y5A4_9PEZI
MGEIHASRIFIVAKSSSSQAERNLELLRLQNAVCDATNKAAAWQRHDGGRAEDCTNDTPRMAGANKHCSPTRAWVPCRSTRCPRLAPCGLANGRRCTGSGAVLAASLEPFFGIGACVEGLVITESGVDGGVGERPRCGVAGGWRASQQWQQPWPIDGSPSSSTEQDSPHPLAVSCGRGRPDWNARLGQATHPLDSTWMVGCGRRVARATLLDARRLQVPLIFPPPSCPRP